MNTGILLMATRHPYYGKMAYNLALSIRATGSELPIVVLHGGRGLAHLNDRQKAIFDKMIEIPTEGFAAKLDLYKYSPFKKTLYLDADTAWLPKKKPEDLLATLEGVKFQAIVEGWHDYDTGESKLHPKYNLWADIGVIKKHYPVKGKIYQFRSEVMYFEKDSTIKKMFDKAAAIQKKPAFEAPLFGGEVPDELALNIAASIIGVEPGTESWNVSYWYNILKKSLPLPILAQQYYVLSAGGNTVNPVVKKYYNTIIAAASYKRGVQFLFTLHSKRDTINERALM